MTNAGPPQHSPYLPFDPTVALYSSSLGSFTPYEFSDFRTEEESWKRTAYLHAGLNPPMPHRLTGPDALRLLRDACINDFTRFSIGASKQAVLCNTAGRIMADGTVLRVGEQEYISYFLTPYLDYLIASGRYDVTGTDLTGQVFLHQVGGPRSLDVIEAATGEDFSDLPFIWHRPATIPHPETGVLLQVRIYRLGVAGTLAYEVHGDASDAPAVYQALHDAGRPLGIVKLGLRAYGMNHTENGFAQSFLHFLPAWTDDPDFLDWMGVTANTAFSSLPGSAGTDPSKRYATPLELGWGHLITYDHDFTGRAALENTSAQRTPVTLIWNPDDVTDVFASQFRSGHEHPFMDLAANPIWTGDNSVVHTDDVLLDGELVGTSSGRIFSSSYHSMISLALLDVRHTTLGTQLDIVWGDPGTRQKQIRATVARYPMLDLPRNKDIDTTG
ncbi:glycine cleavage system aminomethyltransferase T [Rathayibacter sp. PhB152]|uniref:aminomethyltransferase family protein n=1 Tax=unclassified Rathayibacter TaxID=2609250 RepID=UPI000F4C5257|nr:MULTISPECIES: aminomethyltransferase family protein [unclassified Rathayibacter]ROQ58968.1 glycine cleavage system aminomethyltransferase T [Rathayibacter sp. PhB152]ROS30029.1 glycine cleavage system aminomethyltransferase T [Rathayibacter sp. PhB127]